MTNITQIYTIGYEDKDSSRLIERLKLNNIELLVDVREIANSRKRGFAKTALSEALGDQGIDYIHMPKLGSPRDARKELRKTGAFPEFAAKYIEHLGDHEDAIARLKDHTNRSITCLMCYEARHEQCHRSILASLIKNSENGSIEAIHLE